MDLRGKPFFVVDDKKHTIEDCYALHYDPNRTSCKVSDGIALFMTMEGSFVHAYESDIDRKARYEALRDELGIIHSIGN